MGDWIRTSITRICNPARNRFRAHPQKLAHSTGLEPVTYGLEDRCSNPTELRVDLFWLLDLGMQLFQSSNLAYPYVVARTAFVGTK